jgi:acetyl-CoA acetyltransferase family protein
MTRYCARSGEPGSTSSLRWAPRRQSRDEAGTYPRMWTRLEMTKENDANMQNQAVIIDAVRSPIGKHNGQLSGVRPDDLLAAVFRALVDRAGLDPASLDDVYAGCCNQAGEDCRDVARMSTLLAGFPKEVSGITVNRNCASGLDAVNLAARTILTGECEILIGGGVESMSRAPWSMPKPERPQPIGNPPIYDTTIGWRYNNPKLDAMYPIISLGETAENIAAEMGISREDQDAFGLESQRRAVEAIKAGRFRDEIVPIAVPQRKGPPISIETDEFPRYKVVEGEYLLDTSMQDLARLKPAFRQGGTVTAGNSSGINDGAAALLVMSEARARQLDLKPMVRWVGSAVAGVDPGVMGYGPVPATQKLLGRLGLRIEDVGLIELNEAFAAQAIGVMRRLGLDHRITNVNGGAIALGHPIGCSGARILTTLIHEMKRRAPQERRPYYGLATLCVGVGMGVSTLVEWVD